jgi:glycosyltransferase involved in cell wall biosynthesis
MRLNIQAPINKLSYGIMSANIVRELSLLGVEVVLFPIGRVDVPTEIIQPALINEMIGRQKQDFSLNHSLRIYHQFDLAPRIGRCEHIGFATFELDAFKQEEIQHIKACDGVITASAWGKSILDKYLPNNTLGPAPLGVDRTVFNEDIQFSPANQQRDSKDKFIVLHTGKLEKRKGILETICAFNLAFRPGDDVELWLLSSRTFLNQSEQAYWHSQIKDLKNNALARKTKLFWDFFDTQRAVADLTIQADCGIFLSRGEGWGLPALEMMACGKDVILTNYAGHTEFATAESAHLIDIDELEVASDGKWFTSDIGQWAKIGERQVIEAAADMRNLYEKKIASKGVTAVERSKQFTWERTARVIQGAFESV